MKSNAIWWNEPTFIGKSRTRVRSKVMCEDVCVGIDVSNGPGGGSPLRRRQLHDAAGVKDNKRQVAFFLSA